MPGGGGLVATVTSAAGVVGGMLLSEVATTLLRRKVSSSIPWWAGEMGMGLALGFIAKKLGFARYARPLAIGGIVMGARDILATQGLTGPSIANKLGLGDFVTTDDGGMNGLEYGLASANDGGVQLLGLGDYVTNDKPAWA